jgi:hypothetical protein
MEMILREIERALDAQLYYPAVVMTLTLPDICAALESPDGKTSGQKYKDWYNRYLAEVSPGMTDVDCYSLRCGVVHQGRVGHPNLRYSRIVFSLPQSAFRGSLVSGFNAGSDEVFLMLDAEQFCHAVMNQVRIWMEEKETDATVKMNLPRLVQFRPNGLPPNIAGVPLIA